VVAAVIDLVVPPGAVPARISHTISYTLPADTPALSLIAGRTVSGPELVVDPRQPIVIAPPVHGNGWLNGNGCCMAHSVHRSPRLVIDGARYIKPETFAIDWARIQDGQLNTGDGSQNEQHFAFGAEIVSVAAGTVVAVHDGMPEQTPNQPPVGIEQAGDYVGNDVVVQILPDVYAIYAHLQPGSIAVEVGERVTTGELLGRLGNSGNSSAPHLHFQLSDGPDALSSTSLPFVFDRYTLAGTLNLARGGSGTRGSHCTRGTAHRGDAAAPDRHLPALPHRAGLSLTLQEPCACFRPAWLSGLIAPIALVSWHWAGTRQRRAIGRRPSSGIPMQRRARA